MIEEEQESVEVTDTLQPMEELPDSENVCGNLENVSSGSLENVSSDTFENEIQVLIPDDHMHLDNHCNHLQPECSREIPHSYELKIGVSNASTNNLSPYFQAELNSSEAAIIPLYEGATITLTEGIAKHFLWFTEHPGTSKQVLTDILCMQHQSILPKGNLLPDSYQAALKVVNSFLVTPLVFDVCPNDCVIFRGPNADLENCLKCIANRYKSREKCAPHRRFHYLPLGPRLERLFGTSNLPQLVQAHKCLPMCSTMFDVHDSPAWENAYSDAGMFEGDSRGISLGLCTDGVNPFSHLRSSYSMWPIVMSLLNLPRDVRHDFKNMFLVGIIPGNGKKEAHTIHPYLEILVDEMISLSSTSMYDAYSKANFKLKVEVLFHILDYPGVGKVFNMHGAGSYKGCLWCDVKGMHAFTYTRTLNVMPYIFILYKGTYSKTLNKMVYLESRRFLPVSSSLRRDKMNFPSKSKELLPPPKSRTCNHIAHDNAKNK